MMIRLTLTISTLLWALQLAHSRIIVSVDRIRILKTNKDWEGDTEDWDVNRGTLTLKSGTWNKGQVEFKKSGGKKWRVKNNKNKDCKPKKNKSDSSGFYSCYFRYDNSQNKAKFCAI
ncbi:expressed unknown protein [Seminavis robusta]|uniref:Uncharacterized protein n=1 Tax=Seminavis robusta TaxID=568900 RepID=A0A9N8DVK6_9STRA|nr:expressed unknown protein [Seminavis robusta]|eukprot:Sro376_g129740.1 n/a (117) ;mRNA; r:34281-34631